MVGYRAGKSETGLQRHAGPNSPGSAPTHVMLLTSCFLFLFCAGNSFSQEITARASTDKTQYLVGDYVEYTISIEYDKGTKIFPPDIIADSLRNVVLLRKEKPVEEEKSGRQIVTYQYTLAGYDSAGVTVPQIAVTYQIPGDSTRRIVYTNSVGFTILTLKVNPQAEIKDVKPPEMIMLNWKLVVFWVLVGLYVVGILLYYYLLNRKKQVKADLTKKELLLPPHVAALNALRELDERRLWQQGRVKEYHSSITEIVRRYFEERFDMPAMELPTSEALDFLRQKLDTEPIIGTTQDFLSNADMVKFAKFTPLNSVNEEMMKQAIEIVNLTIPKAEGDGRGPSENQPDKEEMRADHVV